MITYATIAQLRQRLSLPAGNEDTDRTLYGVLRQATTQIERYSARRFAPVKQSRAIHYQTPYSLRMDRDLLEVHEIINGDGLLTAVDEVRLLPAEDWPKHAIVIPGAAATMFFFGGYSDEPITVTGIWGWHDDWENAWIDSSDMATAALSLTDTDIVVSDVMAADSVGQAPRFQPGQLIRIDDEYMHIHAVDETTDTISVIRGVRGTTTAIHAINSQISIYAPPVDVQAICLRWASWLYQQQNAAIGAGADWLYPPELPQDIQRLLGPLRAQRVA